MSVLTRDKAVAEAIDFIQTCPLKGTYVKIELEASLGRDDDDFHEDYSECGQCDGDGEIFCDCDEGEYENNGEVLECTTCGGSGRVICNYCDGVGRQENDSVSYSDDHCQEFILDSVSAGCRQAITYSTFYYDGSVDSEFSVTIPLDKPEYAVELIKAFKALGDEMGNGIDTDGAGMHIAILSDPNGKYGFSDENKILPGHWRNFQASVNHLMPALLFLASADHKSRNLNYRSPEVSDQKGYAISLRDDSVIEWRVFETCYNRPEMFYDYLCVIANTLKFYTPKRVTLPFFNKIGELGLPDGYGVHRFFYTEKHLDALEEGLKVLRPAFRTRAECLKLRNFKITKRQLRLKAIKQTIAAETEWSFMRKNRKQKLAEYTEAVANRIEREIIEKQSWGSFTSPEEIEIFRKQRIADALIYFNKDNPSTKRAYIQLKLNQTRNYQHMVRV